MRRRWKHLQINACLRNDGTSATDFERAQGRCICESVQMFVLLNGYAGTVGFPSGS